MRWVWLTLVVAIALVAAAFTVQNSTFTAALQLDLGFAAWRLQRPASVPVLMWSSFAAGMLLAGGWLGLRSARLSSRVRQLEQEAALGAVRTPPAAGTKDTQRDPWAG